MAESTSTLPNRRTQASINLAETRAANTWPGGLQGLLSDYREGRTTLKEIFRVSHIDFRAAQRLFAHHGIPIRDYATANKIAHDLNPQWGERISRSKLECPFRHPSHVTAAATEKRVKLFAEHPERHGNAHVRMTAREREIGDFLEELGISYAFSQHAGGYWLDFWLKDLAIGLEMQRSAHLPEEKRDSVICKELSLSTLIYVPTLYLRVGLGTYIKSLFRTLKHDHHSLAPAIGNARYLCNRYSHADAHWYGFGFTTRWAERRDAE